MATGSKPELTELAEQIQSVHADLEKILVSAQPLLHRHLELLESYVDVSEDLFVDLCEKDGYLDYVEALGRLQSAARHLDALAFVGRYTSSRDLQERPLLMS
jgi:hypothetical protein